MFHFLLFHLFSSLLECLRASSAPFRPRFPTEGRNKKIILVLRILYNGPFMTMDPSWHTSSVFCVSSVFLSFLWGSPRKKKRWKPPLYFVVLYTSYLVIENSLWHTSSVFCIVRDKLDWLIYWFASFRWFRREWIWSWIEPQLEASRFKKFWLGSSEYPI